MAVLECMSRCVHHGALTESDERHDEDLRARPEEDGEQHSFTRWSEHIAVHQLPAKLLLSILLQNTDKVSVGAERSGCGFSGWFGLHTSNEEVV